MTGQESSDLSCRMFTLKEILSLLEKLRANPNVIDGDAAVEWVVEQLQGDQ